MARQADLWRCTASLFGLAFFQGWQVSAEPLIVGVLARDLNFSPTVLGAVAAAESTSFAAAMIFGPAILRSLDLRVVGIAMLILSSMANLLSVGVTSAWTLAALRSAAGLAGGSAAAVAYLVVARTPFIDRLSAVLAVVGLLLTSIVLAGAGHAAADGASGLFLFLALLGPAAILPTWFLKPPPPRPLQNHDAPRLTGRSGWFAIASVLAGIGPAMPWVFAERIGASIGLTVSAVGELLAVTALAGIAGGVAAFGLGGRVSASLVASLSLALLGLSAAALPLAPSPSSYTAAISGMTFFFVLGSPFLVVIACEIDPSGSLSSRSAGVGSLAAALAPLAAGTWLAHFPMASLAVFPAALTLAAALIVAAVSRTSPPANKADAPYYPATTWRRHDA